MRTFQINQLFAGLTPLQTLALAGAQQRAAGRALVAAARAQRAPWSTKRATLLEQFHLADVMDQQTRVLAYGKRRLLEIAIARGQQPRVLLLDEPVAGVPGRRARGDPRHVAALPADVTVLLIEHDMDLVFSFADADVGAGQRRAAGRRRAEEIARDPRVRAVYLGEAAPWLSLRAAARSRT